jgi:hypothetical protein
VRGSAAAFLAFALIQPTAFAKDAADSKDHPLVGRYKGAEIGSYTTRDFNKAAILKAPLEGATATAAGGPLLIRDYTGKPTVMGGVLGAWIAAKAGAP